MPLIELNQMDGVNWGTGVVPQESWVNPALTYRTRSGKPVVAILIKLHNSCGDEVTCPVKGSILISAPGKPHRYRYSIWTIDGRSRTFGSEHPDDLMLVTE